MSCGMDRILLQDYLENTIDPLERIFVEEHLKSCRECRRELTELKLLFWDLDSMSNTRVEIPEELDTIKYDLLEEFAGAGKPAGIIKSSTKFLEFVPGVRQSRSLVKKGTKSMQSALKKQLVKSAKGLLAK